MQIVHGKLAFPFIVLLLAGAAVPLSPSAEAGSWGFSGSYRGGIGFGYGRHLGYHRSARYSNRYGYGYGRHGVYPGIYRYSRSRYCRSCGYRRGYYYGGNRYSQRGSYRLPASLANDSVYESNPRRDPWKLLAEGQIQSAQQLFAQQAERFPSNGVSKLGYALAAALSGNFERAEWAMRRAFRTDPASLESVRMDPVLKDRLVTIASYYEDNLALKTSNPNTPFMLAALKFVNRDHQPASDYIELAIASGDLEVSTFNLKKQLSGLQGS